MGLQSRMNSLLQGILPSFTFVPDEFVNLAVRFQSLDQLYKKIGPLPGW
jgi:hypothetical protein